MSNIGEGFDRRTNSLFIDLPGRSKASAGAVKSQHYIALDLSCIDKKTFKKAYDICDKLLRQISRLIQYLETARGQSRQENSQCE